MISKTAKGCDISWARRCSTSLLWLLVIGAFGGLFVARRLLNRVDAMSAKAATLLREDLSGRLPLSGSDDEIDRLARNLNAMLDRIASLMDGIRQVSDNIAHDLRTPLTRLRNNAEQALQSSEGEAACRAALEQVIEEADGLIRIFNALLMIARAETQTSGERSRRSRRCGAGATTWPNFTSPRRRRQAWSWSLKRLIPCRFAASAS